MTTGRINQVTTFRPAFAAIVYSRVIEHSLSRCGVRHSLMVFSSRSIAAQDGLFLSVRVTHPLEPTNGITSFPILAHLKWDPLVPWKEQRSPTFNGDYQRPMTPKRHTRRRGGSPSGLKLHQVWPSASNPPPSTSLKHVAQGQLEASKASRAKGPQNHQGRSPFQVRLPA